VGSGGKAAQASFTKSCLEPLGGLLDAVRRFYGHIESHPEPSEDHPELPGDVWIQPSGATPKRQEMSRSCPKPSDVSKLSGIIQRQSEAVQVRYVATDTFVI